MSSSRGRWRARRADVSANGNIAPPQISIAFSCRKGGLGFRSSRISSCAPSGGLGRARGGGAASAFRSGIQKAKNPRPNGRNSGTVLLTTSRKGFIDHLAEGKNAESFFREILKSH